MVSISSSRLIRERTRDFCQGLKDWNDPRKLSTIINKIAALIQEEYDIIPERERIGKGAVYISRYISKEMVSFLKNEIAVEKQYFITLSKKLFALGEETVDYKVLHYALYIFAEFITQFPGEFLNQTSLIEKWANHDEWQIRESTGEAILSGLKKRPEVVLNYLLKLAQNENPNLRRLVSESLRPRADVKWLRDHTKNGRIMEILTLIRKDPSIYVRKSVGNNIKDLSKYMPEKVLDLMKNWIKESGIKVHDELASENDLSKENKWLIWTIKHALRWMKERNPEFHDKIEKILGKHYLLYFNEKRNRLARPK